MAIIWEVNEKSPPHPTNIFPFFCLLWDIREFICRQGQIPVKEKVDIGECEVREMTADLIL